MSLLLVTHLGYLFSISCFILGIKRLARVRTSRSANGLAALGMFTAVLTQLIELGYINYAYMAAGILVGGSIGAVMAYRVQMTAMPQLVAVLNGFGGAASALVALSLFYASERGRVLAATPVQGMQGAGIALTMVLSVIIGSVTLSGSLMAFAKLSERLGRRFGKPILLPARHWIGAALLAVVLALAYYWSFHAAAPHQARLAAFLLTLSALLLGVLAVMPIGGADMPVVISLLNSYSGLAAAATGFVIRQPVLIVSGALVGASGMILTNIMCKAMNRSIVSVMLGGFGAAEGQSKSGGQEYGSVRQADPEEAAMDFDAAQNVIIVPGYGLAVAQAQNAIAALAAELKRRGCKVRYAIHPVAGRMPGHMNVLLAEAKIPYEELFEMERVNDDFKETDIALIVGANDVVNPAAKDDPNSPLYGMPVLSVDEARIVYVIKRSLSPGFAGVKNVLFEKENCCMIFGDAKQVLEELTAALESRDRAA